jgi:sugar phosphate isomerase/epimerase
MNEMTTYRWSFDNDVAEYRAAGIPAIGVWRQKLSDYGEEKGIELLAETGLPVSNLLWAGGFTGSCGHSFRESVDDAIEAIRLAAALKAGCLVVYSGRPASPSALARRSAGAAGRSRGSWTSDRSLRVTLAI